MKRFTERLEDGSTRLNIADYGEPPYPVVTNDFVRKLAEYEDTGLTPQEIEQMKARMPLHQWAGESPDKMSIFGVTVSKIIELTKAEKQGRLVILPCKIGDTIYQTCYKCVCTLGHRHLHSTCNSPIECRKCDAVNIERWIRETTFSFDMLERIGEDFFVTREEAEEVLRSK